MARSLLLAWSSPLSSDTAAEFQEWYEQTHIPQVRAAIPSITTVSRYELVDPDSPQPSNRYLAIYEMDDADIHTAATALAQGAAAGRIQMTTAMDLTDDPPAVQWCRSHPA